MQNITYFDPKTNVLGEGGEIDVFQRKKKNYCYTLQILGSQWPCIKSASNKMEKQQFHQDVGRQTQSPGDVKVLEEGQPETVSSVQAMRFPESDL